MEASYTITDNYQDFGIMGIAQVIVLLLALALQAPGFPVAEVEEEKNKMIPPANVVTFGKVVNEVLTLHPTCTVWIPSGGGKERLSEHDMAEIHESVDNFGTGILNMAAPDLWRSPCGLCFVQVSAGRAAAAQVQRELQRASLTKKYNSCHRAAQPSVEVVFTKHNGTRGNTDAPVGQTARRTITIRQQGNKRAFLSVDCPGRGGTPPEFRLSGARGIAPAVASARCNGRHGLGGTTQNVSMFGVRPYVDPVGSVRHSGPVPSEKFNI